MHVGAVGFDAGLQEIVKGELALFNVNLGLRGVTVDIGVFNDTSDFAVNGHGAESSDAG